MLRYYPEIIICTLCLILAILGVWKLVELSEYVMQHAQCEWTP